MKDFNGFLELLDKETLLRMVDEKSKRTQELQSEKGKFHSMSKEYNYIGNLDLSGMGMIICLLEEYHAWLHDDE